jgi:hypothetical protein
MAHQPARHPDNILYNALRASENDLMPPGQLKAASEGRFRLPIMPDTT